jgi:hypothetical protein
MAGDDGLICAYLLGSRGGSWGPTRIGPTGSHAA